MDNRTYHNNLTRFSGSQSITYSYRVPTGTTTRTPRCLGSSFSGTLEKSFKAYRVTYHNNAFPLTQASIAALINNSKPPSPQQQIKNNLTPSLELNPFLLTGSWGPCTLTNPYLNDQMEVVVSSWNFKGMAESIKVIKWSLKKLN